MALLNRDIKEGGGDHAAQRQIVGGLVFGDLLAFARDLRALIAARALELADALVERGQVRRGDGFARYPISHLDVGRRLLR